jgi:ketosteroid isomerase-like protein
MSQENVGIVRAFIDALNRGDLEAALKQMDSDFEFDFSRAVGPVSGVFKRDQIRALLDEFFGMWEAVRFEVDELVEAGDLVVALWTARVKGRDGIEVPARTAWVWTIRDGTVKRICFYQERQDALEAVGVSEQDTHADAP